MPPCSPTSPCRVSADEDEKPLFVTFTRSGEFFAVGALAVRHIIDYSEVVEAARVSSHLHGVANVDGTIIAVVDLAAHLAQRPRTATHRTCVLVTATGRDEDEHVGILADLLIAMRGFEEHDIEAPRLPCAARPFIAGTARIGARSVSIVDARRLLPPALQHEEDRNPVSAAA